MSGPVPIRMFGTRRGLSMVMQSEGAECSLACLCMIARFHGHDIDLPSLRRRFTTSLKGIGLGRTIEIANALGFETRPLRAELEHLEQVQAPCILHWDMNHFVVLAGVTRKGVEIYDPARGRQVLPLASVGKHFTGVVLELAPSADFKPIKETRRITLNALTGQVTGLKRILTQALGLAFAIEILTLALLFQLQWVVDQVLLTSDTSLLVVMTLGFLLVVAIRTGLSLARGWLLSWLGATLHSQWIVNLFSHLLKLPLDFFEKRHLGDVVSRFTSIHAVQRTLTGSFVEGVLDGVLGVLTLIVLCLYSLPLAVLVVAVTALYGALRWAVFRKMWQISDEQLVYGARQQSELMESIRGMQAIKLAGKQSQRRARLASATGELAERDMRAQRIMLAFGAINQGLFGIQRVLLIALGAHLTLQGFFSAGMLIVFVSYSDQFAIRVGGLVDKWVAFGILRLHLERMSDIALAPPEEIHGTYSGPEPDAGIVLENLSFRYAESEPWIVRNVNLTIPSGESIAIVGPSGCGKSTLVKLILGLLQPAEGRVLVGGIDIKNYGIDKFRKMTGSVMQDDDLFAGSIADNVSFFDHQADGEDVVNAAKVAAIHDDIVKMPMGYETLVGDMGSTLSGGQKQRVLLARALYRKPRILVLDEATSHLDSSNEAAINGSIRQLNITRIIIAHRQETISSVERVLEVRTLNR